MDTKNNTENQEVAQGAPTPEAGSGVASRLDFGKFAPLPWRAYDTQDFRGWVIKDARDRTVAIMGNYMPTREAAETIVFAVNAWANSEIRRLEAAIASRVEG